MILGFKKQFKKPIKAKQKKHTIREDKNGRWKPGVKIHMATGVRTKKYKQFREEYCISTQSFKITWFDEVDPGEGILFEIEVDGRVLNLAENIQLAVNDGFDSLPDFLEWFNKDFTGKIIHWTYLKY